jgi:hypothetical protein
MKRVRELYHRNHGFIRNLTDEPIQVGGLVGGLILEPWPAVELPSPMWEVAPDMPVGTIFTDARTGNYRQDLPVRPGNWWSDGIRAYAPVVYVVSEDVEIPPDRHDLIRRWQI